MKRQDLRLLQMFGLGNQDYKTSENGNQVKILFRFYSDIFEKEMVETMWATIVDKDKGLYQLDNIPFYVPSIACGDILFAEYDTVEKMLTFRDTVAYSGNSVIQVVVYELEANEIRDVFVELGCTSEKMENHYFSMEIPKSVNYFKVKQKLEDLEKKEIIGYAEPCLADGHRNDISAN